jgi:hypothetical protein
VVKNRGQHCCDIDLGGYLSNTTGPVSLVLDVRVTHDRVGSSDDPALNGHLRYPNFWISPLTTHLLIKYVDIALTTVIIRPGV